jgi:hypothetical protein
VLLLLVLLKGGHGKLHMLAVAVDAVLVRAVGVGQARHVAQLRWQRGRGCVQEVGRVERVVLVLMLLRVLVWVVEGGEGGVVEVELELEVEGVRV